MATQALAAQAEKIAGNLPSLFSRVDTVYNRIKGRVPKHMISERDMRIPLKLTSGGRPGYFNPESGPMGRGSYSDTAAMIATWFPLRCNFELPLLAKDGTATSEQSRLNVFREAVKDAVPEFSAFQDRLFHVADSTARMGNAISHTTGSGNSIYTMDNIAGVMPFRVGEFYSLYDATLVTPRDSATPRKLLAINEDARTLTFSGTVTSAANTDAVVFEGQGNIASPVGPKGLAYYVSTATTGNMLTLSRTTYPQLIPALRDANGAPPTFQMGLHIASKILRKRGIQRGIPPGFTAILNTDQEANIRAQVYNMSSVDLGRGGSLNMDIMPAIDHEFKFAGVPAMLSIHQMNDRITYTSWNNWMIGQIKEETFFQQPDGSRFHNLYSSVDQSPLAAVWFSLYTMKDFVCQDPGLNGLIYNLPAATY